MKKSGKGIGLLAALYFGGAACKKLTTLPYEVAEVKGGLYLKIEGVDDFYKIEKSPIPVKNYILSGGLGDYSAQSIGEILQSKKLYNPTLDEVLIDYNVKEEEATVKDNRLALKDTDHPVIAIKSISKGSPIYDLLKNEFKKNSVKYILK